MLNLLSYLLPLAQSRGMLDRFQQTLLSPGGTIVIIVALVCAVFAVLSERFKWFLLAVCIYFCSYSTLIRANETKALPVPFSMFAALNQPISYGLIAMLAISVLRPPAVARRRLVHGATVLLVMLQVTLAFRHLAGVNPERGLLELVVYPLLFLVLGIGVARWVYDESEVQKLLRTVSWAAAIMVMASFFVLAVKPNVALDAGRLIGTTANAQRLTAYLALTLPFSLAVFVDKRVEKRTRYLHLAIAAASAVAILGTGSRTGALMSIAGITTFFRKRIGGALLAVSIGTCVALGIYAIFGESLSVGSDRLFWTKNTREGVWLGLLGDFGSSPMFGVDREGTGENSYLTVAATAGVVGLVPMVLFLLAFVSSGLRAARWRSYAGDDRPFADLIAASTVQFLAAWMFEGLLLGTLTDHIVVLFCLLSVMSYMSERIAASQEGQLTVTASAGPLPSHSNMHPAYS